MSSTAVSRSDMCLLTSSMWAGTPSALLARYCTVIVNENFTATVVVFVAFAFVSDKSLQLLPPVVPSAATEERDVPVTPLIPYDGAVDASPAVSPVTNDTAVVTLVANVRDGLLAGHQPSVVEAGLGGTLLMKSANGVDIGVFKPSSEEYGCDSNRKGYSGAEVGGPKRGIPAGEGYLRERAAYLLDQLDGGNDVPPTAITSLVLPGDTLAKTGSLQAFVPHECDAEEIGSSVFPIDEVHRLALLDMRLGNCDRHLGNILVQRSTPDAPARLVPIDHGCVLPATLQDLYFGWQFWPQAQRPLSPAALARLARLDPAADTVALRAALPDLSEEALLVGEVCGMLVKRACSDNRLTVRAVADMMTRGTDDLPSALERLCASAAAAVTGGDAHTAWEASEWCHDVARRAAFLAALATEIDQAIAMRVAHI